jgi:hypothetical protein
MIIIITEYLQVFVSGNASLILIRRTTVPTFFTTARVDDAPAPIPAPLLAPPPSGGEPPVELLSQVAFSLSAAHASLRRKRAARNPRHGVSRPKFVHLLLSDDRLAPSPHLFPNVPPAPTAPNLVLLRCEADRRPRPCFAIAAKTSPVPCAGLQMDLRRCSSIKSTNS